MNNIQGYDSYQVKKEELSGDIKNFHQSSGIPHKKSEILLWIGCQLVIISVYCLLVLCYWYTVPCYYREFLLQVKESSYHLISLNVIKTFFLKLVWFGVN